MWALVWRGESGGASRLKPGMTGRQIRWQNALKIAALAIAGVAVIAALPSLLKPPAPSAPPADVGIATVPEPAPVVLPPPPQPKPPKRKPKPKRKAEKAEREKRHDPKRKREPEAPVTEPPVIAFAPIYPPAPAHEDFGFEN